MKLYTITEAANPLGIYDQLVRRYCKQGRVEGSTFQDGTWYIPEGTQKPGPLTRKERDQDPEKTPSLLKRILYQKVRNNHYGIYEYLQVNLAYSSSRMASNRMTRVQVRGLYRTDRILDGFEPATVDDIIEVINHFAAIDTVLDTIHDTITQAYCKKLHHLLTYGAYADRYQKIAASSYRKKESRTNKGIHTSSEDINKALTALFKTYEKELATLERIVDFHVQF